MRKTRFALAGVVAVCAVVFAPAIASACDLPTTRGGNNFDFLSGGETQTFEGKFGPALNGKFIQIPFEVGAGMTGMKIRYCFDRAAGGASDDSPTLDLGVYGAKPAGATSWTQAERRGWSGSAVRTVGIGENGFTDPATYGTTDTSRKTYVPGFTSRAFKPGPITAGEWAVELGAGWIDPDGAGVEWKVEIVTTSAPEWESTPFAPDPYQPYVANANPGWYTGDLHAHGEMEPGNALMKDTFDLGFGPGGNGLDFITLVDHNNDTSRQVLGAYTAQYPGKLIMPGIEVTTYNGHVNAQYSDYFADFRFSDVYRWDDANEDDTQTDPELTLVRGKIDPSSQLQPLLDGGGFTQVNHPETLRDLPASCRGCAWTYTDEQTDWSKVSALEVANGAGGTPFLNPTGMNPFTESSIALYERLLAEGFHIAAVGSSDDHKAGTDNGFLQGKVGIGATVVHADELSPSGVVTAVRAGHTYIKPFGADAPDVELSAKTPAGATAIPGDSVTGSALAIEIDVRGAASAVRPGPFTLALLKDGVEVDSAQVSGDAYSRTFEVSEPGRYSFRLTRKSGTTVLIEAYSTPVWFTYAPDPVTRPSNAFSFRGFKANRGKGTAILKVRVASPGVVKLSGPGLKGARARVKTKNQTVALKLRPKTGLKRKLRKRGAAKVKVRVANTPTGGRTLVKSKRVKLLGKKATRKRR